jgi:hypothetical protein
MWQAFIAPFPWSGHGFEPIALWCFASIIAEGGTIELA